MSRPAVLPRPRSPDTKRAGHDGFYWPNDRHLMTDDEAIRSRMAEDALVFEDTHGNFDGINEDYFRRRGWTETQIKLHAPEAVSTVTTQRERRAA